MMLRWNGHGGHAPRVLVADRQPMVADALAALLANHGYDVTARVRSGAEAEAALVAGGFDLAIIDIELAAPGPIVLLELLRGRGQRLPVVVTAPCPEHPCWSPSWKAAPTASC